MPAPSNTLLVEGSFPELSEELAQYIDNLNKAEGDKTLQAELAPLLEQIRSSEQGEDAAQDENIGKQREEIMKKLVTASSILNSAPEKGATYLT